MSKLDDHFADGPRFTPKEHLGSDLLNLAMGWAEVGIDPDSFLKCGACHLWMRDCVDREDVTTAEGEFLPGIPDSDCCACSEEEI